MGGEVLSILSLEDDIEEGRVLAAELPKDNITKISWFPVIQNNGQVHAMHPEIILWEQPQMPTVS